MQQEGVYYDQHTLNVITGSATLNQIRETMLKTINSIRDITDKNLKCDFLINRVCDKTGHPAGHSFIFVSNPIVYNILIGLNPDGSERFELVDNPEYVDKPYSVDIKPNTRWADVEEDVPEKIQRKMDPLVELGTYTCDASQLEMLKKIIISKLTKKGEYNPDQEIDLTNSNTYSIRPAFVQILSTNKVHNVLKSNSVPNWITSSHIKDLFYRFATDYTTQQYKKVNGKMVTYTYPDVVQSGDKYTVTFDPMTKDAQFALHMMKRYEFRLKDKSHVLYFDILQKGYHK